MSDKHFVPVQSIMPPMPCQWSVGPFMERFYADLDKKKITGVVCPDCGKVYVPPRKFCSACHALMKKFVAVPPTGKLINFTVAHQKVNGARREQPIVIALVMLEGADTAVFGELRGVEPAAVATGLKVKAVFADQPGITVASLSHFAPAGKK